MREVLIIGHGPSIQGGNHGRMIDGHETVVRFGDSFMYQNPRDHGTKADYVITGDQRVADILIRWNLHNERAREVWVYGRPGFREESVIHQRLKGFSPYVCKETDAWLEKFKAMGARGYCSKRCSDPHFSTGLAAIIVSAERLKAEVIKLLGFDALLSGESSDYWSGTNRGTTIQAQHDFAAEKKLLDEVQDHYGFRIGEWN